MSKLIPDRACARQGLNNLTLLKLSNNRIVTISAGAFRPLAKLTALYLDDNALTQMSQDVFIYTPNLITLSLRTTNIPYINNISSDSLRLLPKLQTLDASNGNVFHICSRGFEHSRALTKLTLSNNAIVELDPKAFVGLDSLLELGACSSDSCAALLTPSCLQTCLGTSLAQSPLSTTNSTSSPGSTWEAMC